MKNGNLILEALEKKNEMPLYTIGVVAELVGTTNQTLRIYEKHGLIKPARKNKNRFYSVNDIRWILCIREMIHDRKISIEGIKKLLEYAPCWELMQCPEDERNRCIAFVDRTKPCWELSRRICNQNGGKTCETCIAYLSSQSRKSRLEGRETKPAAPVRQK
ncbi:MAG: MerR family transcriptional regulator [Nitrospirota bacterium]